MFLALVLTGLEPDVPLAEIPFLLGGRTLLWSLAAVCFIPGFLLAEEASARWRHRAWIYAAVTVLGAVAVALAAVALSDAWGLWIPQRGSVGQRFLRAFLDVFWPIGLAAIVYSSHRRALAAALTFQQLETRRTEMMAHLAESRLRTTRARVQPQAFIAELQGLRRQYLENAASGEAALDRMIVRLRAVSRGVVP